MADNGYSLKGLCVLKTKDADLRNWHWGWARWVWTSSISLERLRRGKEISAQALPAGFPRARGRVRLGPRPLLFPSLPTQEEMRLAGHLSTSTPFLIMGDQGRRGPDSSRPGARRHRRQSYESTGPLAGVGVLLRGSSGDSSGNPPVFHLGRETPHGCRELLVLRAPGSLRVLAQVRGMGSMSQ